MTPEQRRRLEWLKRIEIPAAFDKKHIDNLRHTITTNTSLEFTDEQLAELLRRLLGLWRVQQMLPLLCEGPNEQNKEPGTRSVASRQTQGQVQQLPK